MDKVTIYAAAISTFGRVVAMVCIEKGFDWEIVATNASDPEHLKRHPFGKTPVVEYCGNTLLETDAICRYLDRIGEGGRLIPEDPLAQAEADKWMSFVQHYIFPTSEMGLVMPRIVAPMMGRQADEARVQAALPTIRYQIGLTEAALSDRAFIAGPHFTLADIYLYCTWVAVNQTGEGDDMLRQCPNLQRWMQFVGARESARLTKWPGETKG